MYAHARDAAPEECCGYVAGREGRASNVYRLRNAADDPLDSYFADPGELFFAQRRMRERGESVLGIYHSHPRAADPEPSRRDVRLAFEPSAVYFIIGFAPGGDAVLRAFRVFEGEERWERADFHVSED